MQNRDSYPQRKTDNRGLRTACSGQVFNAKIKKQNAKIHIKMKKGREEWYRPNLTA